MRSEASCKFNQGVKDSAGWLSELADVTEQFQVNRTRSSQ